ncbi:MAG TPA: DUF4838 domain-containing protein [bacterium]|nr:DUF4838 domain-containing protein [bacterium]HOL35794.1 DUF4838 domain-containing protein [bacterium]HPP08986.1 DUF4838 domain-containing protein [bacterium]
MWKSLLQVFFLGICVSLSAETVAERCHKDFSSKAPVVYIAKQGKALVDIVIPETTTAVVKTAADELARCLKVMTGADFKIVQSTKVLPGIVIGRTTDFPELGLSKKLPLLRVEDRQHYILRTVKNHVLCIGASEYGASHAVYDLLERIGCRWYFPGETWEIIPRKQTISIRVDVEEKPDYFMFLLQAADAWGRGDWNRKNRNYPSPLIYNHHNIQNIALALKQKGILTQHPEYNAYNPKAEPGKERTPSSWLCLSNPQLRSTVAEYVLEFFKKNPERDSISLEPMDGDGWCRCEECQKYSPTDLLVMLVNDVAKKLENQFPDKYIGILSYNKHSFPPSIRVHKMVYVLPTTAFNHSGNTIEQQFEKWREKMDNPYIGIYDYWNVPIWWMGRPGIKGSRISYMKEFFPKYYQLGLRVVQTEAIGGWAQNGLAYYIANKLAWNIDTDVDRIVPEFVNNCFKEAAEPMKEFYKLLNQEPKIYWSRDYIGRLFRCLAEARNKVTDPDVIARIDELTIYVGYLERFYRWQEQSIQIDELMKYLWKASNSTKIFEADWIWRYLPERYRIKLPEDIGLWKEQGKFSHQEIEEMNRKGVIENPVIDIKPVKFSTNLVPAGSEKRDKFRAGYRCSSILYIYAEDAIPEITLSPDTQWFLYDGKGKLIEQGKTPAGDTPVEIKFNTKGKGLYRFESKGKLDWKPGAKIAMDVSNSYPVATNRSHYFFVPPGTKKVLLYATSIKQEIYDSDDRILYRYEDKPNVSGYIVVDVPEGQDGKIWKIRGVYVGNIEFLNVPPYIALSPDELLVPVETLKKAK